MVRGSPVSGFAPDSWAAAGPRPTVDAMTYAGDLTPQQAWDLLPSNPGAADTAAVGFSESTVRLSVGLEDVRDLTDDLERALGTLG